MIAVDTNILIYAHREEYPQHQIALMKIAKLAETPFAIPWPCIHEFLSVVTRKQLLLPATPVAIALDQIGSLLATPTLRVLHETDQHWTLLRRLIEGGNVTGKVIHDAKIAAICIQHGVRELWSADRDFSRFPQLKTVNPLIG